MSTSKVQESTDLVAEARLRFMELLTKIQEVDRHAIVYPWLDTDRQNREPAIDNPKAILTLLSNTKICLQDANLPAWQTNISTNLFWIHGTTRQDHGEHWMVVKIYRTGHVESTAPAGRRNHRTQMVTFLADKFDKEALKSQIWETTGVIALRYRAIDNRVTKRDTANTKRVKELHIEVDKADPASSRNRIECLYSLAATVFPLGIKMWMVRELHLLTKADAKVKAASLQTTQQRFLDNMDSSISWGISDT